MSTAPRYCGATIAADRQQTFLSRRREYSAGEFRIRTHIIGGGYAHPARLVDLLGITAGDAHGDRAAASGIHRNFDVLPARIPDFDAPFLVRAELGVATRLTPAGSRVRGRRK